MYNARAHYTMRRNTRCMPMQARGGPIGVQDQVLIVLNRCSYIGGGGPIPSRPFSGRTGGLCVHTVLTFLMYAQTLQQRAVFHQFRNALEKDDATILPHRAAEEVGMLQAADLNADTPIAGTHHIPTAC